ncbi:beta-lactamase-like protein [Lipomyces chichibuensis]|uniref:beta-lactamase-like protein n=1 Tax=Lipomyces chichibuensis TaxID=1546026 RepID=UPI0033432B45
MSSSDLPVCVTCGAQFGILTPPTTCPICDDPRQYVPAAGQSWTTLRKLRESDQYKNEIMQDPEDPDMYSIFTVPQIAIGQRAMLVKSSEGKNILWDCITFIDDDTIERVKALGGISAIVISHPHFYSSHVEWAQAFNCPVYLAAVDKEWVMRLEPSVQHFFDDKNLKLAVDVEVVKVGGHFPGSLVLAWKDMHLLVADSIAVVFSGLGDRVRLPGTTSFTFMWSYPNMIPLDPDSILGIWNAIKDLEFDRVHSGWWGRVVMPRAKERVLESAKIIVRAMGYTQHAMLDVAL